jgi:hypothetical protein
MITSRWWISHETCPNGQFHEVRYQRENCEIFYDYPCFTTTLILRTPIVVPSGRVRAPVAAQ